ncbi:MAG: IS1380 family transposase [Bacteroidales bacterium]|nr:IS1380 family transposase [Bacteroidales bacterium]
MRRFHVHFTEKNLTGNAGLVHFGHFCEKLNLSKLLSKYISIDRGPTARYDTADTVMMLVMGVIAGVKHLSHMAVIRSDGAIRSLFKWEQFPDDTTIGRIFKLFNQKHCKELSDVEAEVRKKVWNKKWFGRVRLDMDSSVRGVWGHQEGAEKGYNPQKRGQRSYNPLFCFIAETRECLHNWFRSGDAYTANGSVEFMKECFARLPKRVWKVDIRADSGFFNGALLDFIESRQGQYTIKVKMKGLVSLLEQQNWHKVPKIDGFEKTEFEYKCSDWKKKRRFVAIRKIREYTEETDNRCLFDSRKIEYEYFCYVTNMDLSPWATHKYYGQRATSENWIEWCKNHMASGSILTQDFWANSAIFQSCILAYNLMVWLMWLNHEEGFKEEPNTIRMWLIAVPARLMHMNRQWFLRLNRNYPYKELWEKIEGSIQQLSFT